VATDLAQNYAAPSPTQFYAASPTIVAEITQQIDDNADLSAHDRHIQSAVLTILAGNGRPRSEQDVLAAERDTFTELAASVPTRERISAMLATGKPLCN
jgi:hypothetical protein